MRNLRNTVAGHADNGEKNCVTSVTPWQAMPITLLLKQKATCHCFSDCPPSLFHMRGRSTQRRSDAAF
eukprot:4783132-Karenia_brevis.AAC.1